MNELPKYLDKFDNFLSEYNVERRKLGPIKTDFEVFARFLRKQNVSLKNCDVKFLYLFFCTCIDFSKNTYYPVACKLCDVKKIIDDFMSEEKEAITQLDFAEEDIECNQNIYHRSPERHKKWLTRIFANPNMIGEAIDHIDSMFKQQTDNKINLDALQTVVYIIPTLFKICNMRY